MSQEQASPSRTARAVAMGRAVGWAGLRDPLALRFLDRPERIAVKALRGLTRLPVAGAAATVAAGGLQVHACLRMAAVDRAVLASLDDGCRQVVVVGAGYDTRAWRLAELRGLALVEVDLPATQAHKQQRVEGLTPVADVQFLPADLSREPLDEVLAGAHLDPAAPTAFVWEAVAPYLPDHAVRATAAAIARTAAPASRLVMTFAHPMPGPLGPTLDAVARLGFHLLGEPLRSTYDDWDMLALLDEVGWLDSVVSTPEMWARDAGVATPVTPLALERMVQASR